VLGTQGDQIWLERMPVDAGSRPRPAAVERFVETALTVPLTQGPVVALGSPHVDSDGNLIVNDCGIVSCLEPDEREAIAALLYGLAAADPDVTAAAAVRATGAAAPVLLDVTWRACSSLSVAWSPISLGLSIHQIAVHAAVHGGRRHACVLFADEFLSRLDLLHLHPHGATPLASPHELALLLAATGFRP
jgi:hypothetical protein